MKPDVTQTATTVEDAPVVFFVHAEGKPPKAVHARASESITEIVRRAGVDLIAGMNIFLDECVDALSEPIDAANGEDGHKPVPDHGHSPHMHGHHHGGHIHCHRHHRLQVVVTYNGQEKRHRFSPATTVETVRLWAIRKFGLSEVDAETLILKLCGVAKPPQVTAHIGELATGGCQELCFELVPDHRING